MLNPNQTLSQLYKTAMATPAETERFMAKKADAEFVAQVLREQGIDPNALSEEEFAAYYEAIMQAVSEEVAKQQAGQAQQQQALTPTSENQPALQPPGATVPPGLGADSYSDKLSQADMEKLAAAQIIESEKLAAAELVQADFIGRVKAHAEVNELMKIASGNPMLRAFVKLAEVLDQAGMPLLSEEEKAALLAAQAQEAAGVPQGTPGAVPVDPAMAAALAAQAGNPPVDPAMLAAAQGGAPVDPAVAAAMAAQGGAPSGAPPAEGGEKKPEGEGEKKSDGGEKEEKKEGEEKKPEEKKEGEGEEPKTASAIYAVQFPSLFKLAEARAQDWLLAHGINVHTRQLMTEIEKTAAARMHRNTEIQDPKTAYLADVMAVQILKDAGFGALLG